MIDYRSFHKLTYGLYIICSEFDGKKSGYAANTGFQVTSEPSTLAISCNKNNYSCAIIQQRQAFTLSVLRKDLDVSVIGNFGFHSGKDFEKFDNYSFKASELGLPILTEFCVAAFECKVVQSIDVGSHMLFIGEVVSGETFSDDPVLTYEYYHGHYKMLSPKNAPTYIDPALLASAEKEEAQNSSETDEDTSMMPHMCSICGYVYDPAEGDPAMGISPGIPFSELPDDFECPICRATKGYFGVME